MSQFSYDEASEKRLTNSVKDHTSKIASELQQLLELYKKRDDGLQKQADGIIDAANQKAKIIIANANKEAQAIHQEKLAWEAEKNKIAGTHALEPDVTINMGGQVFTTTMTTLRMFPDTMIGVMFSGRHVLNLNKDGAIAVDRDGTHFRHILNFLRDPHNYSVDHLSTSETVELKREATYYGLGELMFPFKKAADETVHSNGGYKVIVSQTDDGIWYMKIGNQAASKVILCGKCKRGHTGNHGYSVENFAQTRKIFDGQPQLIAGQQCPICRCVN